MRKEGVEFGRRSYVDSAYSWVGDLFLLFVIFLLGFLCHVILILRLLVLDQYLACSTHEIAI